MRVSWNCSDWLAIASLCCWDIAIVPLPVSKSRFSWQQKSRPINLDGCWVLGATTVPTLALSRSGCRGRQRSGCPLSLASQAPPGQFCYLVYEGKYIDTCDAVSSERGLVEYRDPCQFRFGRAGGRARNTRNIETNAAAENPRKAPA